MAFFFGDSFDLYASPADAINGYWDGGTTLNASLVPGRFTGSRAINPYTGSPTTISMFKNSGANDSVHHIVVAYSTSTALSGSTVQVYFTFFDGATAQCSIVIRSDGAIVLISGAANGTTLATYTGAITATNTWFAFEVEVVINNTTGSVAIRKNGNTVNDFFAASLNTRAGTANNYANRLGMGGVNTTGYIDDLLWRSDASSVAWVGDIRCYTRMPASDVSVTWTRPATFQMQPYYGTTFNAGIPANLPKYIPFISQGGTIGSVVVNFVAGYTGNLKCAIYASTAGQPGAVLQLATAAISNPVTGANTFTFSPAVSITRGAQFFVAICSDATTGNMTFASAFPYSTAGFTGTTAYASFPAANPSGLSSYNALPVFPVVTVTANADAVADAQQDAAISYIYSSTVGQADLYAIGSISGTPATVIGVTTRGYFQKSDAGTRNVTVDLKSGSTTVSSTSAVLNTTWGWVYRNDLVDPATSAAWSAIAVNNAQIGVTLAA